MRISLLLPLIAFLSTVTGASVADQIVLAPARDNTLYEDDGTLSNGAGQSIFSGQTRFNGARRALLRFNLGSLPAGSQIVGGDLELTCTRSISQAVPYTLHRVTADWGEAGSDAGDPGGTGALAEPGDATWTYRFYDSATWSTPGGDFLATATSSTDIAQEAVYHFTGLVSDIQFWQANAAQNFGWIIIGDETDTASAKRFGSRENLDPLVRPKLTIDFNPPCLGDITGDGVVDLADLAGLLAHFGTSSGATLSDGDLNADGAVDLSDLAILLANFGSACP